MRAARYRLSVLLLVAAMLGSGGLSSDHVEAQLATVQPADTVTSNVFGPAATICEPHRLAHGVPAPGVLTCELFLPILAPTGIPAGTTITVALDPPGLAEFRLDGSALEVLVVTGCAGGVVAPITTDPGTAPAISRTAFTITVHASGCPAGATILVGQRLTCLRDIVGGNLWEVVVARAPGGTVIGSAAGVAARFNDSLGQPLNFPCPQVH